MPKRRGTRWFVLPVTIFSLVACQSTALQTMPGISPGQQGKGQGISRRVLAAPSNDTIANAVPITSLPFNDARDTTEATTEPPETCGKYTVWYSYTPTTDTSVSFDFSESNFQVDQFGGYSPTFEIFRGSPGNLTQETCSGGSFTKFTFLANTTYYLSIGGGEVDSAHDLVFRTYLTPPPPGNDDIGNAKVVTLPYSEKADFDEATANSSDPACISAARSTWYTFTAPESGRVGVRTRTGHSPIGAAIYTGTPGSLTEIACAGQAYVSFDVVAGTTYYVAPYISQSDSGTKATLDLTIAYAQPPINDDVSSPFEVVLNSEGTFRDIRDTTEATFAPGDEDCMFFGQEAGTVWYRFTAPESTLFEANTVGTAFGGTLSVYQQREDGSLELSQCVDSGFGGPPITAQFGTQQGVTYYFKVLGSSAEFPLLTFNVRKLFPPQVTLTVAPTATFNAKTNTIRVTGIISSDNQGTGNVSVSAEQIVGRLTIGGFGFTEFQAPVGPTPVNWAVDIPTDGKWSGGEVTINVGAFIQNTDGTDIESLPTQTVRLSGKR